MSIPLAQVSQVLTEPSHAGQGRVWDGWKTSWFAPQHPTVCCWGPIVSLQGSRVSCEKQIISDFQTGLEYAFLGI